MESSLAMQLLRTLSSGEHKKLEKFLDSPYFNQREDVRRLYHFLRPYLREGLSLPDKKTVFRNIYPGGGYHPATMNHLLNYLSERIERFMAVEEMQEDPEQEALIRCRAFRKRGLGDHFERNATRLQERHKHKTHRNGGYWLFCYQLQSELFFWEALKRNLKPKRLEEAAEALTNFFALENLRWGCAARALQSLAIQAKYDMPMHHAVMDYAADASGEAQAPLLLLRDSYQAMVHPEDETVFHNLKKRIQQHIRLFPPTEARDIYMSAINFCIRRHNQGDRRYTREAFELYRISLDSMLLTENNVLPRHTFINIFNLALLVGEKNWALDFLETHQDNLPASDRLSTYQYALATFHFRHSEYQKALPLLQNVDLNEPFLKLDVRKMLLRSYFELEEWSALASLLDSFYVFLQRQKGLGYHRESYLNLVRYTRKVARLYRGPAVRRRQLAHRIEAESALAEKQWLLEKVVP